MDAVRVSPMVLGAVLLAGWSVAQAGSIRATVVADKPVQRVFAIERRPTATGVEMIQTVGRLEGDRLIIDNLPDAGVFDLKLETASGVVQGWNATVPPSDYLQEQPLSDAGRQQVLEKLQRMNRRGFADQVAVLDVQGNIHHAAVLLHQLRTRPFVGGDYQPGEWVWRVDRWHWTDPDEHTWAPDPRTPWYALERRRLYRRDYDALSVLFARHLGGIRLDADQPDVDLGKVVVPRPPAGVHACEPDGTLITPVVLKPETQTVESEVDG